MQIEINPEIRQSQQYSCLNCGRGCRSFLVTISDKQARQIEQLRNWPEELGVKELFVSARPAHKKGLGLARRENGDCVFLSSDNLCLIHKLHGLKAKPHACQLFPFVLTPFDGRLKVGLRFDCPGVCNSGGRQLSEYMKELRYLAGELVPPRGADVPPPAIRPGQKVSAKRFEAVNDLLLNIVTSNAMPLTQRLRWLVMFTEHLGKVKWANVSEDDFQPLMSLIKSASLTEARREKPVRRAIDTKNRRLLGQIFFLLAHPPEIMTAVRPPLRQRLRQRMRTLAHMRQLRFSKGPLPKLQPDWPDCDLASLESSFGPWPVEVDQLLQRYMTCRVGGMNYCGPNFYNYSMTEGANSLVLAIITIGWLMRIEAVKNKRDRIELPDAQTAVITIDGNMGYASALGSGPARMRLRYLSAHLRQFIDWYGM